MGTKKGSFTITQAARKLGISRQAVHEAIRKGQLKAKRGQIQVVQTVWLIPAAALRAYKVSLSHKQRGKKKK
ncbi:MAG: helix-turn-helix domain-containing protein [Candidatus Binatia bacterium]